MRDETTPPMKKVTLLLPRDLAEHAPAELGKASLTEAVRDALRDALHRQACKELLELRGKVKFQYTWQEMKAMDD